LILPVQGATAATTDISVIAQIHGT